MRNTKQIRRKAFGQHFLTDAKVIETILTETLKGAENAGCASLLEIGPGRGALTEPLLKHIQAPLTHFTVIEKDRNLSELWGDLNLGEGIHYHFLSADFLELPPEAWLGTSPTPLAVVSNLPYSAGTAIFDRLSRQVSKIGVMVLMFQAEVAQRIRADQDTPHRGSLSLWSQNLWQMKRLLSVPPRAFRPPPKVDSEVLLFTPRKSPKIQATAGVENQALWEQLLKACFAQRRKMLRSGLAGTPFQAALERSGIDGTLRAQALDWPQWERLFLAAQGSTR